MCVIGALRTLGRIWKKRIDTMCYRFKHLDLNSYGLEPLNRPIANLAHVDKLARCQVFAVALLICNGQAGADARRY